MVLENGFEKFVLKWLCSYMWGFFFIIINFGLLEVSVDVLIGILVVVLEFKIFDGVVNLVDDIVMWFILGGFGEGIFVIDSEMGEIIMIDSLCLVLLNFYV